MENYYDHEAGDWVTCWSRYQAIASRPPFDQLDGFELQIEPARSWELILALLAAVPEDVVHHVGAGPLESFVVTHGAAFVDEIEAAARDNPRFRSAAMEINLARETLPPTVESRLVAAFGPRFILLPDIDPDDA